MISVEEALALIDAYRPDCGDVQISLLKANNYTLAQDVFAQFTHPAFPSSVMDGYALRKADLPYELTVIGESRAGQPFDGVIGEKEAVRIFTGATLPVGADVVEIQEHAIRDGDMVSFPKISNDQDYVRVVGSDFTKGNLLFRDGTRITPAIISAIATANVGMIAVKRKPRIAILRGGDELRSVGSTLERGQIIDSNGPGLIALLSGWGFEVSDLGIVFDDPAAINERLSDCDADVIIPVGGASVGDYDLMKAAFSDLGFVSVFEKVAVKPGRPIWLSHRPKQDQKTDNGRGQIVLGLPGNPHSVFVCAHLFLTRLLGRAASWKTYRLKEDLPPNAIRERFIRGTLDSNAEVSPIEAQQGPTLSMAQTKVLIRRAPLADALLAGQLVDCLHIDF